MRIASLLIAVLFCTTPLAAAELSAEQQARLLAAYPEHLTSIEEGMLVWRDGTRMPLDDRKGAKPFQAWLEDPDIEDMLAVPYTTGALAKPPPKDVDPGRARNPAFFDKIYGDCRQGGAAKNLTTVVWLPNKSGQRLRFAITNGAAAALQAVSRALDALPARFDRYLIPAAGTYNCRTIAGTDRVSAHGYGIAIDIAVKQSDYWRWSRPGADGAYPYRNEIPMEIVRAFEQNGFIWGGKWHHYDTMHFEYRPELVGRGR